MHILRATEAIKPAIARTKLVLFKPFRLGRTWKLCATSYLAASANIFIPYPLIYLCMLGRLPHKAVFISVFVLCILAATALVIYIFHLCSRLQFAFFDILVNRGQFVAPAWRKYGPQSRKWTLVKVLLGTTLGSAVTAPCVFFFYRIFKTMASIKPGQPPPPDFFASFFLMYALIILGFGFLFMVGFVLTDFIVPSLALEDTTLSTAFARLGMLIRNEPGQFTAYFFLKLLLAFGGYIGVTIVLEFVLFFLIMVAGLIVFVIGTALHAVHIPEPVWIACIVLGVLALYSFVFYIMTFGMGLLTTFLQAYAVYFLGGRYALLGDLLDRSTPPVEPNIPPPNYLAYATPAYQPAPPGELP